MKFRETKKIEVGDLEFHVRLTTRAIIGYDELTGRNWWVDFGAEEIKHEKLAQLFYVTAKAGAKEKGIEFKYTYEQFLDMTDDYPESIALFYGIMQEQENKDDGIKKK